jgi:hypothetical protein
MIFETCVCNHWKGETCAVSESKAKSNLAYQYKKNNNLVASAKVNLPGKVTIIE